MLFFIIWGKICAERKDKISLFQWWALCVLHWNGSSSRVAPNMVLVPVSVMLGTCHFSGQQDLPAPQINRDIKFLKHKNLIIRKYGNFKDGANVKLMRFRKAKFKVLHLDWGNPHCQYRLEDKYLKEESKRLFEINSSDLLCNFSLTYCQSPRLFVQWNKVQQMCINNDL